MKRFISLCFVVAFFSVFQAAHAGRHCRPDPQLVKKGKEIFFNETFNGNGRTCGTCHPLTNNFTIDPSFIASLPKNDPLFVAEFNPALATLERPQLMRQFGLILENLDGFENLDSVFVLRGVPHTLGLRLSVASDMGPRTGWSGDGAPGDGTLRSFATGAVIQHFTRTLDRVAGVDFRLPSDQELDALEAFQLSLGPQKELALPLALKSVVTSRGQAIFLDQNLGKCTNCHFNAGANADPAIFGPNAGNRNFNTGVENLPDQPRDLTDIFVPIDDGFGIPGDSTFNTVSLVEAADTGPFFHNNAIETIEGAVAFFNGAAFNNSPSGQAIGGIQLDATQVVQVAAFLRVINVLENIRQSIELLEQTTEKNPWNRCSQSNYPSHSTIDVRERIEQAEAEILDAIDVLKCGGLHPRAVGFLEDALQLTQSILPENRRAFSSKLRMQASANKAIHRLEKARADIVEE